MSLAQQSQQPRARWSTHVSYLNANSDHNYFQSPVPSLKKTQFPSSEEAGKMTYFTKKLEKLPLPQRGIDLFRSKGKLYSQEICSRQHYSSLQSTFPSQRLNSKVSVSRVQVFRNSHMKQRKESSDEERPIFQEPPIKMHQLCESLHQKHPFYFKNLNPYHKSSADHSFASSAKGALKNHFLMNKARQEMERKKLKITQKDEKEPKSTPRKKMFKTLAKNKFEGTPILQRTSFHQNKCPPGEVFSINKYEATRPTEKSCCKKKQESEQLRTIQLSEQMEKIYSHQTLRQYLTTRELEELLRGYQFAHIDPKRWTLLAADEVYKRIRNRYELKPEFPQR